MNGRGRGRASRIILLHLPVDCFSTTQNCMKELSNKSERHKRDTTCRKQHGKKIPLFVGSRGKRLPKRSLLFPHRCSSGRNILLK